MAAALAAPPTASAQIDAPAAAEARAQGFDARETLGPDVSLDRSGDDEGLVRVELDDGAALTTHGPDITATAGEHGTTIGPGDPERARVCAASDAQHVLYGVPADQASRYPAVVPEIQGIMRRMNAVLNSESLDSGGAEADYRMRCNADGGVKGDTFAGPPGDDSFEAARASGGRRRTGGVRYSADPGYRGADSFVYRVATVAEERPRRGSTSAKRSPRRSVLSRPPTGLSESRAGSTQPR